MAVVIFWSPVDEVFILSGSGPIIIRKYYDFICTAAMNQLRRARFNALFYQINTHIASF
jgi:hypothetical protein